MYEMISTIRVLKTCLMRINVISVKQNLLDHLQGCLKHHRGLLSKFRIFCTCFFIMLNMWTDHGFVLSWSIRLDCFRIFVEFPKVLTINVFSTSLLVHMREQTTGCVHFFILTFQQWFLQDNFQKFKTSQSYHVIFYVERGMLCCGWWPECSNTGALYKLNELRLTAFY